MSRKVRLSIILLLGVGILSLTTACGALPAAQSEMSGDKAGQDSAAMQGGGSGMSIEVEPIGHWHIYDTKPITITVMDTENDEGMADLNVRVQIAQSQSSKVAEFSVEGGQVKDRGNGVYTLQYQPTILGGYALTASLTHEEHDFFSAPVAFDTSRAGEEGIKVEAKGTSYVYQIRYNWDPGALAANDTNAAKLDFEIMRGIQEGQDINWEKPWSNTSDHITNAANAKIVLKSTDGSISEELATVYKGKGVYEATRLFSASEVGQGKDYTAELIFIDPYNGAQVTHAKPFKLHVDPAK